MTTAIDAAPTPPTFEEAAIRSGLVSVSKFARAVEIAGTREPEAVAEALVRSGIVTQYQANQLRDGRTKLTLGPYLITDFIGQGGMGRVFKAVHQVMGRECAVKVLPREKSTHESRDSFRREIRVQAGLDSPYVVRAFDAGQDGKVHYLVTEYVPGTDLRRLVRSQGPLSMGEAALIISQVAMGLQYAHDLGLIHRDIKPGNILVTPDGHAKLSDIGLAAWSMGLQDDPRAGKIVGTADYLSPEQIRDPMSVGPLSDIYALGCTLYYTVTGKVPFPGGDSRSKCRRHCEETPWHPRNLTPDLSEDFVDTIADMMEKDPARRIPSAAEVAERLEPWASAASAINHGSLASSDDHRQWTPPPPPHEPSQIRELPETPQLSGSAVSIGELDSAVHSQTSGGSLPLGFELESTPVRRRSHIMPIAISLAIAIPISLLAGAIIGFLLHDRI
ncbi:serine/threonine-protein kinase [Rubripirellula reticaptiva]|uniref:Serine/threonine-protein kinase StkP n=1 Tax=Rubripirellula reticaptiva TaxID=2528013 RepID=A0A5C6EPU2_9BACT|nr:serine/threonine-protein kinase [Rubripirellula reticaptiva]TWU49389.1 Serine/threonine-protein kinase StkP [Rubripirellula reticaptiva]